MKNNIKTIIFCGLDGSGKTTQARKLFDYFKSKKIKAKYVWLRYPNRLSIPIAILLRLFRISAYPIPEYKRKKGISNLSKHNFLKNLWKKVLLQDFKFVSYYKVFLPLKNGNLVILDRYVIDAFIELCINSNEKLTKEASTKFLDLIPKNSTIFFLDIDPKISYERNHEEEEEIIELKRSLYLQLFKFVDVSVINGNKPIDAVHNIIKEKLNLF